MRGRTGRRTAPAVHALFFVSGAAGLVYQIVWMRLLVLVFGATAFAISTVLTAFMAGLALGSFLMGRRADRRGDPLRTYGRLEIGIGMYALAVPWLFDALAPLYRHLWLTFEPGLTGFALLKFAGSLTVLLLPTTLMGATLPVLARWATQRQETIGVRVGSLYAINTLGAVAGTVLCGFVLIRTLGMHGTIVAAAAANLVLGLGALVLSRRAGESAHPSPAVDPPVAGDAAPSPAAPPELDPDAERGLPRPVLLAAFALSGFAALLLEVAWTRILTLVIGGSVYAFALMLTAFLTGLAGGAALLAPLADRVRRHRVLLLGGLLGGAGLASAASLWLFGALPWLFAREFHDLVDRPGLLTGFTFALCCLVMVPATLMLGGVFPVMVRLDARRPSGVGRSVGEVYAANTAGTIAGAFAGGFLFIPVLGLQGTVLASASLEIALAALLVALGAAWPVARRLLLAAGLLLIVPALWTARPAWNTLLMNSGLYLYAADLPPGFDRATFRDYTESGYRQLYYREGATATILVGEEVANGNVFLSVNGKVDASSGSDMQTQVLSGQLPILLHPDPRDILVVGLASGVTAGSVATHPIARLDVVEIEAAVVEASRFFDGVSHRPLDDPRVRTIVNDGRNFLLFTDRMYDVIISEPSNPWLTGASNLFTREYFELVAARLRPAGLSCQWIQAYNMVLPDLRSLLATYAAVFPHVLLFDLEGSDLLLIGSRATLRFDLEALRERLRLLDVAVDLGRVGIRTPEDILAWFAFGEAEMGAFTAGAPHNTDDNARVEFSAPWSLFKETGGENSRALAAAAAAPEAYLAVPFGGGASEAGYHRRLAAALYARSQYDRALLRIDRAQELAPGPENERLRAAIRRHLVR